MGLDDDVIQGLYFGGLLHDIGKIAIPTDILNKPGRLSNIEYLLIQQHPQKGYDIIKDIDFPWPVAQMILQHHEHLDGSGYPQGLTSEHILLEAKILMVADVVEAMYSHRPYRAGLGIDKALEEIKLGRGSHYEPRVVDACLQLFAEYNDDIRLLFEN
jgi:HD-GYP domain-containing protein (c-di-GMP phosphodiesterase class II)